jgi:prevent-host-death family protein
MRMVGVREAQSQLSGLVLKSQKERIILTRHGKPVAVLSGVEGMDLEDVLLGQDQAFARHIERRRLSRKPLLTMGQVKSRLARRSVRRTGTQARSRGRAKG